MDHRFTDANSIFFRYTHAQHQTSANGIFTDHGRPEPGRRSDQPESRPVRSHTFSPTLINNLRIGAMRQSFDFQAINAGKDWPVKLGLPPIVPPDQFPQIDFGFGVIGGGAYGARGSLNWDIQDLVTKITGNHTLKIGYNHRILQGSNRQGAALSGDYPLAALSPDQQSAERGRHWLQPRAVFAWRSELSGY